MCVLQQFKEWAVAAQEDDRLKTVQIQVLDEVQQGELAPAERGSMVDIEDSPSGNNRVFGKGILYRSGNHGALTFGLAGAILGFVGISDSVSVSKTRE